MLVVTLVLMRMLFSVKYAGRLTEICAVKKKKKRIVTKSHNVQFFIVDKYVTVQTQFFKHVPFSWLDDNLNITGIGIALEDNNAI